MKFPSDDIAVPALNVAPPLGAPSNVKPVIGLQENACIAADPPVHSLYTSPTTSVPDAAIAYTSPELAPGGSAAPSQLGPGEGHSAGTLAAAAQDPVAAGPVPVPPITVPSGDNARIWLAAKLLGTTVRVLEPEELIDQLRGVRELPAAVVPLPATIDPSADTQQAVVLENTTPSMLVVLNSTKPPEAVQRNAWVTPLLEFLA